MHSSISSFDPGIVTVRHAKIILLGLLAGLLLVLIAENIIRMAGGEPNVKDTAELWASERARASSVGKNALILLGSSRMQLDMDLGVLAEMTGMSPVQLAIDGSPYLEVLENLANDADVEGTVLISTTLLKLAPGGYNRRVTKWIDTYENGFKGLWSPRLEQRLKARLQSVSALYANLIPMDRLIERIFTHGKLGKLFLKTYPSRQRDADYSLVKMPDYYIRRVERNLGQPLPQTAYDSYEKLQQDVIQITRENHRAYKPVPEKYTRIKRAINDLKKRGVEVVITRLPQSGLIETMTDIRYPKSLWESVVKDFGVRVIDYRDYPQLQFQLPDGSHLDMTQKKAFTREFSRILLATEHE